MTCFVFASSGLVGVLLAEQNAKLDKQTSLLHAQNAKIDLQTVTAEAQRRAGLAAELFAILQTVSLMKAKGSGPQQLKPGLISRIVAFSRAATPYWTIDMLIGENGAAMPYLADRSRSPERGQRLTGLVGSRINPPQGATFSSADLREAVLTGADLSQANLSEADL